MFRKPKKKVVARQPIGEGWEEPAKQEDSEASESTKEVKREEEVAATKPPALLSFDHDEGADVEFNVKKSKKKAEELKRQIKLEEETRIQMDQEDKRKRKEKKEKDEKMDKKKYLDRYRGANDKNIRPSSDDSDVEILPENDDTHDKFPQTFGGIPDSRAVFEAKKQRERLRRGEGIIPLDEDKKIREKGTRERLVREDDNDDSDEDAGRFYSSRDLVKTEEEHRREEQNHFLEQEQGDDDERLPEDDEWEKQQILKAVSRHTIGRIRDEYDMSNINERILNQDENRRPHMFEEDMDIDMDVEVLKTSYSGGQNVINTGGEIKIEDIMAKLKLRIQDRQEALKTRRYEIDKMERVLFDKKQSIDKIQSEIPNFADKFRMYQELKVYMRNLLDCLNEKVKEINDLSDRKRFVAKSRTERIIKRRRKDMNDQYAECSAVSSGKNLNTVRCGEAGTRAAERDARRGRRRRERENSLEGISHEDGLSSDDEETTSQQMNDQTTLNEINAGLTSVFVDTHDEFANLKKVLERMVDWLAVDGKSFQEAYVHMCIPKLCSPYIRLQMTQADILKNSNFTLPSMQWYLDTLLAGSSHSEIKSDHDVIVELIPKMVEKVIVPYLTDVINDEWDPLSLSQTRNLCQLLSGFDIYPTLTPKSKPFVNMVDAIKTKLTSCIDDDLWAPMFSKQSIENPNTGCRSFLDRQFWTAIKLIRCVNCFSDILSPAVRFALVVENIVNKVCVLGIQFGATNDVSCERKVKALMAEMTADFYTVASSQSFRSLTSCLNRVLADQKTAGRDFYRDVQKYVNKLNPG